MNALIAILVPLWVVCSVVLFLEGLWVLGILALILPALTVAAFIRRYSD